MFCPCTSDRERIRESSYIQTGKDHFEESQRTGPLLRSAVYRQRSESRPEDRYNRHPAPGGSSTLWRVVWCMDTGGSNAGLTGGVCWQMEGCIKSVDFL